MRIIYYVFYLIIFSFLSNNSLSGQIDSMLQVLEKGDISDRERILTHNRCAHYFSNVDSSQFNFHKNKVDSIAYSTNDSLGKFLSNTLNISYFLNLEKLDSAEVYIHKNIKRARDLDKSSFMSGTLYELAMLKAKINQKDSAIYYAEKVYKRDKSDPDVHPINLNHTIVFLGKLYKSQLDYDRALTLYLEADSIANMIDSNERTQYKYDIKAEANNSIASLYKTIGDTSLSIKYYKNAVGLYLQSKNYKNLSYSYRSLADIYEVRQPDSSLFYINKAYDYSKKLNSPVVHGYNSQQLGDIWNEKNNSTKAIKYWEEALDVFVKLKKLNAQAGIKLRMGRLERQNGNYEKSLSHVNDAHNLYVDTKFAEGIYASLDHKSIVLEKMGRYKESLYALNESNILKDSLDQKKYDIKVREIQTKFETAKKETLLVQQEAELVKQQSIRNIFIGSSLLGLLLALAFWNRSRLAKKILQQETEINTQKIEKLEKEKKILAMSSMIEGQEAERIRIAKDLHDGIGGLLSTVKAHFSNIQAEVAKVKKMNVYDKTNELIDQASSEVRRISHNLMPGALRLDGLHAAIEQLAEDLDSAHSMKVRAEIIGADEPRDEQTQVYLFRIIQEASNNAIKYAEAKNFLIQFSSTENEYHLILEDDGKGFDASELSKLDGLGLKSIKSRVEQLNGVLDINAKLGEGTSLSIHIPKL